ncbi:MAG: hypothetical protein BWY59_01915 [Verrucomicrobia bacterium ADurb.Bin345]|nr:MAG: hypothetical protein BWY59_01915 [Verrucomicrobia bacterium ADurb.Bin345]
MTNPIRNLGLTARRAAAVAAVLAALPAALQAAERVPAHIVLRDRKRIECFVERSDNAGVFWSLKMDDAHTVHLPFDEIAFIRFDPPEGWEDAISAFRRGDHDDARRRLSLIAETNKRFVTAPGNFSTKAQFWILESFKAQQKLDELSKGIEGFNAAVLADHERHGGELMYIWADVARSQWAEARKKLDALLSSNLDVARQTELWFLRGLVLARQEQRDAAIMDLTKVFTVGYGVSPMLERSALMQTIELLAQTERLDEARALLDLYRVNFGKGSLPARLQELQARLPAAPEAPAPAAP